MFKTEINCQTGAITEVPVPQNEVDRLAAQDTTASTQAARRFAIQVEIQALEAKAHRPTRAMLLAVLGGTTPGPDDVAKLSEINDSIAALRLELSTLTAQAAE